MQFDHPRLYIGLLDLPDLPIPEILVSQNAENVVIEDFCAVTGPLLQADISLHKVNGRGFSGGVVNPVVELLLDRLLLDPQILQGAGVDADTLACYIGVAVHIGAVLALALSSPQDTVFAVFSPFGHSNRSFSKGALTGGIIPYQGPDCHYS